MKKTYHKPTLSSYGDTQGIIPALFAAAATAASVAGSAIAPGLLLAGGYAVGRSVKEEMGVHEYVSRTRALEPVGTC